MRTNPSIVYLKSFFPLDNQKQLRERQVKEFCKRFHISRADVFAACDAAWDEQQRFWNDVKQMGNQALEEIRKRRLEAIVLAGRPYHLDPTINQGIPELANSLGLAVLAKHSVAHLGVVERPFRAGDHCGYHNRQNIARPA
jgi:predicted nucleotide-binding protein (sugar kinase/HSP70/actin superfamily)